MLGGMPWHGSVLGNDPHLKETEVVFWVTDEGCSCSTSWLNWFLKIKLLNAVWLHGTRTEFAVLSLSNFLDWGSSTGECRCWLQLTSFRPSLNGEPRSSCLPKEEIRQGQKFIKGKENSHSARHQQTDNGWRWRSQPDNGTELSHSATFSPSFTSISLHNLSVFSCEISIMADLELQTMTKNINMCR